MMSLVLRGQEGISIFTEQETMGNQFIRMKLLVLDELRRDFKSGFFLRCANGPGLDAMTKRADEVDLLVPDGSEVKIGRAHVELQSPCNLVCRLLLEKKKIN